MSDDRLTPQQMGALLLQLEGLDKNMADKIRAHLDARDDALTVLDIQREMGALMAQVGGALEGHTATLRLMQPVHERGVKALEDIAVEERRSNDLEERRLDEQATNKATWVDKVWGPLAGAVVALLGAWAAAGFSGCA